MATLQLNKRPVLLTILCIICFILLVGSFMTVSSPFVRVLGTWYPALFGIIILSKFAATVGVWYMKKWGVLLYSTTFIFSQFVYTTLDQVSYPEVIFNGIVVVVFLSFYKRMDKNL